MSIHNLVNQIIRNQDKITRLVAEIQSMLSFHPRAAKLMQKRKPFVVVAEDEPYYLHVYSIIRTHEMQKTTWTEIDEQRYQDALKLKIKNNLCEEHLSVKANDNWCPYCLVEERDTLRARAERAEAERDNLRRAIEDHQATINKWVDLYGEAHDQLLATEADAERLYDALKLCLPYAKEDYYSPETNECPYCDGNGDGDHKSNCKQVAAYFAARAAIRGHADTLAAHEARKGGEG